MVGRASSVNWVIDENDVNAEPAEIAETSRAPCGASSDVSARSASSALISPMLPLLHRDPRTKHHHCGAWAAGQRERRRTGVDSVEAQIEAERQVRLGKPPRAASIINRSKTLFVRRLRDRSIGYDGPPRRGDAAADVAPPCAGSEIERELRTKIGESFGDGPKRARRILRPVRPRCHDATANPERDRAVLERIRMDRHVATKPPTGEFTRIESPAQGEIRIGGKPGKGAMNIEDEARNGRQLLRVGLPCAAEDGGERA